MADIKDLIEICKGKHVYIQTHNFPDPDAIATAFGLQNLFKKFDIESTLCYEGKIDKISTKKMTDLFNIDIHGYGTLKDTMKEEDYIICVDSQKLGGNTTDFVGDEIAAIDHHPTYKEVEYKYKDIRQVGACATIICGYYKDLGIEPDALTASALLYGLKMDTAQLTRGVTEEDIDAFAYLFPLSDSSLVTKLERNTLEFADLKAYGAAIENIKVFGRVGFSYIPFSCPDAVIAIISDFILQLNEVEVAIVYSAREDGMKFSVRSEAEDVDAGKIANEALKEWGNGGGHASMAGGLIKSDNLDKLGPYPDAVINQIFLHVMGEDRPQ
ncbi:MAG: DHH family phosphoesterase [Lachnospiraceae bacterium]|nr:DHH family phosphoesterase [Lachnospiraceae bacterium]